MSTVQNLIKNRSFHFFMNKIKLQCTNSKRLSSPNAACSYVQYSTRPHNTAEVDVNEESTDNNVVFKGMETEFPCTSVGPGSGPEPEYAKVVSGYQTYSHNQPFYMRYHGAVLPRIDIAYETWGELNTERSNAVIIHAGLSASSHARSHPDNTLPGWWEKFVGPGCAIDTDKYFVICTNTLGSCYGTSGPSSINPLTKKPYGTTFPVISVADMVKAQFLLLDHLGIDKTPPSSIALRYLARKMIMTDPNWNQGNYYDGPYPLNGMKMAREIGTLTYRSGPEWNERFARLKLNEQEDPTLCPTFLIESYLEHQGNTFSTKYDPNSLLYISKAMDLFDVAEGYPSLDTALSNVKGPVLVIGVQSDVLFPIWQQRDLAKGLQNAGNELVTFYELNSIFGHDTFLLDLNGVGAAVKGFLDTKLSQTGVLSKSQKAS